MKVVLPIWYYKNTDEVSLEDLGITGTQDKPRELRMQTFYSIGSVVPTPSGAHILSQGEVFVCPWSADKVVKAIDEAMTKDLILTLQN